MARISAQSRSTMRADACPGPLGRRSGGPDLQGAEGSKHFGRGMAPRRPDRGSGRGCDSPRWARRATGSTRPRPPTSCTCRSGRWSASMIVHETNPPLYFVLGWLWARVFGTGEVGLRSLSALIGTAVIPIAYLCGRELVSRRAGLVAAALAALSPFMIWYSQEAQGVHAAGRPVRRCRCCTSRGPGATPRRGTSRCGRCSRRSRVLTHFFAGFLVAPEALWLLYVIRNRAIAIAAGARRGRAVRAAPAAGHARHRVAARIHHGDAARHADPAGARGVRARHPVPEPARQLRAARRGGARRRLDRAAARRSRRAAASRRGARPPRSRRASCSCRWSSRCSARTTTSRAR